MVVSSSGTHAMLRAAEKGTSCIKKKTNNINNRCWFFIYSKTKCSSQYLAILWDAIVKAIWIKKKHFWSIIPSFGSVRDRREWTHKTINMVKIVDKEWVESNFSKYMFQLVHLNGCQRVFWRFFYFGRFQRGIHNKMSKNTKKYPWTLLIVANVSTCF